MVTDSHIMTCGHNYSSFLIAKLIKVLFSPYTTDWFSNGNDTFYKKILCK